MDSYTLIKTLHVLSAAVLFGTGLGIAFFMFVGMKSNDLARQLFAAKATVMADFWFTLPAVIIQPLSGVYLVLKSGMSWNSAWLLWAYGLFLFAGVCWLPVVYIQIRIHRLLQQVGTRPGDSDTEFGKLFRLWFILGWPAFATVIAIYWLMIAKPA